MAAVTSPGMVGLSGSKGVALRGSAMYKVTIVSLVPLSDTSVMMTWPGRKVTVVCCDLCGNGEQKTTYVYSEPFCGVSPRHGASALSIV